MPLLTHVSLAHGVQESNEVISRRTQDNVRHLHCCVGSRAAVAIRARRAPGAEMDGKFFRFRSAVNKRLYSF